jgi:cell division septum initiation protein DivIVA
VTISNGSVLRPGNLSAAREHITARRGLTGRWYKAEEVDELLDGLTGRLALVMGELERVRRAYGRLADIDHARRHGALPSGMPIEAIDQDQVEWRIREQEAVDRMLDDATRQAAAIIADARQQYLVTAERAGSSAHDNHDHNHNDYGNDDYGGGPDHYGDRARAERAEARLNEVGLFLEQWTRFLIERDATHRRAAAQHTDDLANARKAASGLLADFTRMPGPSHSGVT